MVLFKFNVFKMYAGVGGGSQDVIVDKCGTHILPQLHHNYNQTTEQP